MTPLAAIIGIAICVIAVGILLARIAGPRTTKPPALIPDEPWRDEWAAHADEWDAEFGDREDGAR